jgi:hypothetical protein
LGTALSGWQVWPGFSRLKEHPGRATSLLGRTNPSTSHSRTLCSSLDPTGRARLARSLGDPKRPGGLDGHTRPLSCTGWWGGVSLPHAPNAGCIIGAHSARTLAPSGYALVQRNAGDGVGGSRGELGVEAGWEGRERTVV